MKLTIKNALYSAGTILLGSAILSQFKHANLIIATLLVLIAVAVMVRGYQKDKKRVKQCLGEKPSRKKIGLVAMGATLLFLGLGFAMGKLIYLWSHI